MQPSGGGGQCPSGMCTVHPAPKALRPMRAVPSLRPSQYEFRPVGAASWRGCRVAAAAAARVAGDGPGAVGRVCGSWHGGEQCITAPAPHSS